MAEKKATKKVTKSNKPAPVRATKEKTPVRAKKTTEKSSVTATKNTDTKTTKKDVSLSKVRVKKSYVLTFLGVLLLVLAIFLVRKYLIAAMVNGQPISRLSVIRDLERQGGKQTLDTLITKSLIKQEAKKKNVTISQKDIDNEIKRLESTFSQQGQKLEQVLQMNGMTKEQLIEQIELQKIIEKIVGKKEVTSKEIDDYIERNRESLPQDQDDATLRKNTKERLEQQQLNERAEAFLENLRKNAKIEYYINY